MPDTTITTATLPPTTRMHFTQHAIERYARRTLGYRGAVEDLTGDARMRVIERMRADALPNATIVPFGQQPTWVDATRPNSFYAVVHNDARIVFPLVLEDGRWVALTCLHRAHADPVKRVSPFPQRRRRAHA